MADPGARAKGLADIATRKGPIDVSVANAVIIADWTHHRMPREQWRLGVDIDPVGYFCMLRNGIEDILECCVERIVNISSSGPKLILP